MADAELEAGQQAQAELSSGEAGIGGLSGRPALKDREKVEWEERLELEDRRRAGRYEMG